jgi:glycosyltransferase involved in cell wall biosynthesis
MKILHIINTLEIGGAQSVLVQLLEGWGNGREHQLVVSLRKRGQLSAKIEALNVPVLHLDMTPGTFNFKKFLQLIQIIRSYKPDLIQTWLYHSDLLGSIGARFTGRAPIVWGVHHTTADVNSVKPATWGVVRILSLLSTRLPSQIICCSSSAYQTHIALGYSKEKMKIVYNGVDTNQFKPDPNAQALIQKELGLSKQAKLIGMFARYHPQKDHDTFILAAAKLLQKHPNVHFVLAGDGVDSSNKHLREKLLQEGIQYNFHLLGSRQDMPYLCAGMNIVSLTSSYGEALPMTLCEAMSCAVPCVATDVGDTASLIGDTGKVVKPNAPQELADTWQVILEYSDMEYNRLCDQARSRIFEFYNQKDMIHNYKFIYKELIASK